MSSGSGTDSQPPPYFECEGWWEQNVYGRQPMEPLQMAFGSGIIQGYGHDIIGPFTFEGTMEEGGVVVMRKQYIEQHSVAYFGTYDGEGLMMGDWRIDGWTGRWMIRLRRLASETVDEIKQFGPLDARVDHSSFSN